VVDANRFVPHAERCSKMARTCIEPFEQRVAETHCYLAGVRRAVCDVELCRQGGGQDSRNKVRIDAWVSSIRFYRIRSAAGRIVCEEGNDGLPDATLHVKVHGVVVTGPPCTAAAINADGGCHANSGERARQN
jgi:hypothetical protein